MLSDISENANIYVFTSHIYMPAKLIYPLAFS